MIDETACSASPAAREGGLDRPDGERGGSDGRGVVGHSGEAGWQDVLSGSARWCVVQGDCLETMRAMPDVYVDSVVTDPPAGIGFMGKEWDDFRRSRNTADTGRDSPFGRASRTGPEYARRPRQAFIETMTPIFGEALRVLKPGGHAVVWAIPRTSHWTATALEDAGFEIRDCLTHLFGSGFPKSMSLDEVAVGWGTALKPSSEHWWLCRKPSKGTVAACVMEHGTGGINVEACRTESGRWPTNLVLTHSADCGGTCVPDCPVAELNRQSGQLTSGANPTRRGSDKFRGVYADFAGQSECQPVRGQDTGTASRFYPTFEWQEEDFAPFRYVAKPSTTEREKGCESLPRRTAAKCVGREPDSAGMQSPRAGAGRTAENRGNHHPTVKPIALMEWLVTLVTPLGGIVLDPFTGSGTTGAACVRKGVRFIGCEREPEYVEIARARIEPKGVLL